MWFLHQNFSPRELHLYRALEHARKNLSESSSNMPLQHYKLLTKNQSTGFSSDPEISLSCGNYQGGLSSSKRSYVAHGKHKHMNKTKPPGTRRRPEV